MIAILQQFFKALVATMTACKHKAVVQEKEVTALTKKLTAMTAERDLLVAEQKEAMKMIDEMTIELNKKQGDTMGYSVTNSDRLAMIEILNYAWHVKFSASREKGSTFTRWIYKQLTQ